MSKKIFVAINLFFIIFVVAGFAGTIPSGYEKIKWGTHFSYVYKKFPRGQLTKLGETVVFKQQNPTKKIARRNFAFTNGNLSAVSITFEKKYVETIGIEKLLDQQIKAFGQGVMDRLKAPHMINYVWQGADTRITFAYAPKRADMTVLIYEQKKASAP